MSHSSLNDELAYETRVKPITSSPIFNAGMERFVRDWRSAHVAVTVKDARMRENDVILGTVFLKVCPNVSQASYVLTHRPAIRHLCERFRGYSLLLPRKWSGLRAHQDFTSIPSC